LNIDKKCCGTCDSSIEEGYFEYGNFEFENGNFEKQSGELKTKWGTKNICSKTGISNLT